MRDTAVVRDAGLYKHAAPVHDFSGGNPEQNQSESSCDTMAPAPGEDTAKKVR